MIKLIYSDLVDRNTFTSKVMSKHQEKIQALENKLEKLKTFDIAFTNYLQVKKEIDYETYNCIVAWFEHSDLTVSEIFQKIREED